jgi:diamine N-acetyltransferase
MAMNESMDETVAAWAEVTRDEDRPGLPRSVRDGGHVMLDAVTADNVRSVCRLRVARAQRRFVAPNAVSLAEALFEPKAWYRAITADGVLVGFVMLYLDEAEARYYLWRLMIGEGFQALGFGRAAVLQIIEHVRRLPNASELTVGYVPGAEGPEAFYAHLGFEPTGEIDGIDVVARLRL